VRVIRTLDKSLQIIQAYRIAECEMK
jgi:hypothetical protein